jgi:ABC-type antimicrobial peptide transport system permease subunit
MLKNVLIITLRNFIRQKGYSLINLLGLAVGMASFILIMLWVEEELSYENFHQNADHIFLTYKGYTLGGKTEYNASVCFPLGPHIKQNFPEANHVVRVIDQGGTISYQDKVFNEYGFVFADAEFFHMFSYEIIRGNPEKFFAARQNVVISESIAEKYFGDEDPMGKVLTRNRSEQYVVSGVVSDPPYNTQIDARIIVNIDAFMEGEKYTDVWTDHFLQLYVQVNDAGQKEILEQKMTNVMIEKMETEQTSIRLQPIKKLHLYSMNGKNEGLQYVVTFSLIAIFIILIACINFMNLTTARYSNRAREIGLKKVVGVSRWQLVSQFLLESVFMTLMAAILAMMLAEVVRPWFNELTGKSLQFNYLGSALMLRLAGLILVVGLLSGSYPALILSKFQPADILRKNMQRGEKGAIFRRALVVLQFAIATILIFSAVIIYRQLSFISNKDLGYQTEDILYLPVEDKIGTQYESFRNELLASPYIEDAGRCSQLPPRITWIMRGIQLDGYEEGVAFGVASVDYSFFSTVKIPIVEGRAFSRDLEKDSAAVIFNEESMKLVGKENLVGQNISFYEDEPPVKVIGRVPNFHSQPLSNAMEPLVFLIWEDSYNYVVVRAAPGMASEAKDHIEGLWTQYAPGFPFSCRYMDDYVSRLYRDEEKVSKLAGILTILALFISSLGLIGLTAFIIEQKYKEIGLRKVFGSSIYQLQYLISSQYIRWILLATFIAIPVAWFWMDSWLNNFAYRIHIRFIDFFLTSALTLVVAVIITYLQVLRASLMKPVDVLKYE